MNVECSHARQRGIALVLTLILLSVTLVMALAFLAISGHERNSVTTQTDATAARLATDAGLAAAEAQIAANIQSTANPYAFGLLVSTNYVLPSTGNPFTDLLNLQASPRAPVWLSNTVTHVMENRFYLDLNRNGVDDPNGWVVDPATGTTQFEVGDPEWIGILQHPDQPYSATNPFVARYTFIAQPVGNSLDLDAIHNQVFDEPSTATTAPISVNPNVANSDVFFRNQGVGPWELNLAAFLADLNTNAWPSYAYNEWLGSPNSGVAFDDARALLAWRYANNFSTLASVDNLFGGPSGAGDAAFRYDNIDGYGDGPLQTGFQLPGDVVLPRANDNPSLPWAGADNTNHFFDVTADLFDPAKTAVGVSAASAAAGADFSGRLLNAGADVNSAYDRYTFYRMLSQLGTDTSPESGLMNLNYDNLDPGFNGALVSNGSASGTNFVPWQPLNFFMNAADRMLRDYTTQWATTYTNRNGTLVPGVNPGFVSTFNVTAPFGVSDIPVWVSNRFVYTPAVQRLLQLAANIYDASTNAYYPSVFRPVFSTENSGGYVNVFITGYTNVAPMPETDPTTDWQLGAPVDASTVRGVNVVTNVYGVPWIIGAKKGFPNFNAFTVENVFKITRKLQLTRPNTTVTYLTSPNSYTISQQLTASLANLLDVECWNSYRANYTNAQPMQILATVANTVVLTNDEGLNYPIGNYYANSISTSDWPGYGSYATLRQTSFLYPLYSTNEVVLPASAYTFNLATPFVPPTTANFVNNTLSPHWGLLVTNRVRVVMLEKNANDGLYHVIDYVQLAGPDSSHDLTADVQSLYDTGINSEYDDMWDTSLNSQGWPVGIANQLGVSMGAVAPILSPYWAQQDPTWVTNQIAYFSAFLGFTPTKFPLPQSAGSYITLGQSSTTAQVPYSPTATVVYQTQWGANDPLVHYMASDLTDLNQSTAAAKDVITMSVGQLSDHYMPWGGNPQFPGKDLNPYNLALKDPLISSSDAWNFPAGKFPTVGWLGRVHRGTPWQTVFLKSTNVLDQAHNSGPATWGIWTGNPNQFDADNAAPVSDRLLFDLFTTAFDDNATCGTLSVNQSADSFDPDANPAAGLAAWSAVFSGVVVPPDSPADSYSVIIPAGISPKLEMMVTNINFTRYHFRNNDGLTGVFEHKGDILSAPLLSDQSLFVNPAQTGFDSDAMYEWLPQQVMSLLRVGEPRYVIYSYGQALKPARDGMYLGAGPLFGMVTNYQVVAETAMRSVVRFDTVRTNALAGSTNASNAIIVTPPRAVIERSNILPPE